MELSLSPSGFAVVRKRISSAFTPVLVVSALTAVSVMTGPMTAWGQFQGFGTNTRQLPGRFVEPPRALEQQVREAESALQESQYSDAVVRLGDLLSLETSDFAEDDLLGQDFFIDSKKARTRGTPLNESFKNRVRDMIGNLPAAALETYELRYGPAARKMLEEAAVSRDWQKVREVRRKYFHTDAGYDASWLLAQHEMFTGHPIAASALLDDVVSVPRAVNRLGNGVIVLHAAACGLANRKLPSGLLVPGGVLDQGAEVEIAGVPRAGPKDGELTDWLSQYFGVIDEFKAAQIKDYSVFNANASRNGASSGQLPLSNLRWELDATVSPRQEREVKKLSEELISSGQVPPPSWVPLRVGAQLLMRTTEYLVGVDYRTGKRIWLHPWDDNGSETKKDEASIPGVPGKSGLSELLRQRVWNDVPYGQVTSDGERVYLLEGLKKLSTASLSPMGLRGRPATTNGNTLVALDLASEGKLKWELGTRSSIDSPLSDAFFLGPPLPIDGRLYVLFELAGDICLSCLEPATGNEIWRQQLVAVESGTISRDLIRRVAGAMPSYQEGVLICPTGAGAVVAVNLGDRTLRWGVNYDRNSAMTRFVQGRGTVDTKQLMQRWFTGIAIASDQSVLVTPVEADRLFGFNLLTGKSLFTQKIRLDMRYLAGIRGDRFYVVGSNVMKAYDLATGSQVWKTGSDVFESAQQVSGQGVFGDGFYLLPTTSREIIRVSLDDGSVMDRRVTNYELGNMVAVNGEIITQGPTKLSVAFGEATLRPIVDRMLEENPNDFDALVRKSELLIQEGQTAEALDLLAKARQVQPQNDEVRMLSVSAMLEQLRESHEINPEYAEDIAQLIDRPFERIQFNALLVNAALNGNRMEEAAKLLLELSKLVLVESMEGESADLLLRDNARTCTLDAWLNGRVREFRANASSDEMDAFNTKLIAHLEGKNQSSIDLLRRLLTHFDGLDGIATLREELAIRFLNDRQLRSLESVALGHQKPDQQGMQELSSDRLMMLADAYSRGKMPQNLLLVLGELESRSNELSDASKSRIDLMRSETLEQLDTKEWPANVTYEWQPRASTRISKTSQRFDSIEVLAGEDFRDWALLSSERSSLTLRAPDGTLKRVKIEGWKLSEKQKIGFVSGGVMVVQTVTGLFAVDLYSVLNNEIDAILWRRGIGVAGGNAAKLEGFSAPFGEQIKRYLIESNNMRERPEFRVGAILGDRVIVLQGGELLAIDVFSGETIWRNNRAPKSGAVICSGEQIAVVSSNRSEMVLFDLVDGRELETRPFKHGVIWKSSGENLLCFQPTKEDNVYTVKLVNPFTGETFLTQEANSSNTPNLKSDASVFESRVFSSHYLVMMSVTGETFVWDLREGREIARAELPGHDDLEEVRAMELDGQIVVFPGLKTDVLDKSVPKLITYHSGMHHTVHGAFAFSLEDGALSWSKEFERPWGCTIPQLSRTPLMMLTRSLVDYRATSQRTEVEVLGLDVRNGNVLSAPPLHPVPNSSNQINSTILVDADRSVVEVSLGGIEKIIFQFKTDEEMQQDAEVAPPAEVNDIK